MYQRIISKKNLEDAYFKIASDMELDSRFARYRGWDSLRLSDLELNIPDIIISARQELIALSPLSPAVLFKIPKKSNPQKLREIYIYNLKERIKAQAIYQVIETVFDDFFSPYLFSYRSSHSSYFAARSVVRHYRKYWSRDFVLIGDLSDYSNYIRQDILKEKLLGLGLDGKVLELLYLFIGNDVIRDGRVEKPEIGLVQGVPLIALFNNLYLDEFDKKIGPRVDLYRRVGDDLIAYSQNKTLLEKVEKNLFQEAQNLGLKVNEEKTGLKLPATDFNFLGYHFSKGLISLPPNFYKALVKKWEGQFSYYSSRSGTRKEIMLGKAINRDKQSIREQFKQLAEQKKLVSDEAQLRRLSEAFFRVLTKYFYKDYSPRNRRLLGIKLKGMGLGSLYKSFNITRYGKH